VEAYHVRRFVSDREPELFGVEGGRALWILRLNQNVGAKSVCHVRFSGIALESSHARSKRIDSISFYLRPSAFHLRPDMLLASQNSVVPAAGETVT
jgi:hypothetical protein